MVSLVPGGMDKYVAYEERLKYTKLVQAARMEESKHQVGTVYTTYYGASFRWRVERGGRYTWKEFSVSKVCS